MTRTARPARLARLAVGAALMLGPGGAVILAPGGAALAEEEPITLTIHHFLGPRTVTQTRFIEPWVERIEAESDGRLQFEIFPSMSLGGRPSELYQQARDGVADIVWTLTGYTPGVFPRTEVFELPGVHGGSAEVTNLAIQDVFEEHLAEDYTDVHPILVHVHSGNALHMVDTEVRTITDLAGRKIRIPSRTGAWMLETWGAEPVGMPVPELPQALSRGVVDGTLIPFEVAVPLKVHELTDVHVERAGGARFGTATFLFGMNKDRYDSLPEDLRAIIDARSGAAIAAEIGALWDEVEPQMKALVGETGALIELSAEADAAFAERADAVTARWIEEVDRAGLDGAAIAEAAAAAIAARAAE